MPIVSKLQLPIRLAAHSCAHSSVWLSIKEIRILRIHHPIRVVILETVYLRSYRSWWSFCLSKKWLAQRQLYKSRATLSNNQTWSYYESLLSHYRLLRSRQFVGSCQWGISAFLSFRRWSLINIACCLPLIQLKHVYSKINFKTLDVSALVQKSFTITTTPFCKGA